LCPPSLLTLASLLQELLTAKSKQDLKWRNFDCVHRIVEDKSKCCDIDNCWRCNVKKATGASADVNRSSLGVLKDSSKNTEFSEVIKLKNRQYIKEFTCQVIDARTKFVKKIDVYVCPDVTDDLAALAANDFAWQLAGSLDLPNKGNASGITNGSCKFASGTIASSVKIVYASFYDAKSAANMCPRCARAVTNAAGVCGSCGEVVNQCR